MLSPPRFPVNPLAAVLAGAGLVVLCLFGVAVVVLRPPDPGSSARNSMTPPPSDSGVRPSPTAKAPAANPPPARLPVRHTPIADFFTRSVLTNRGEYLAVSRWTKSCLKEAKPQLARLLKRTPCKGYLQGAMYRSPDSEVYVQMTAMRFGSPQDATRISNAISSTVAPRIRVPYRSEPGHWWSASHAGNHVLIRQSFVNRARKPGSRTSPAQTYGDTLLRRFQAIVTALYTRRAG